MVKSTIILRDLDMNLGENEEEIDFSPNVDSDLARSDQVRMISSASDLEEAKVVVWNDSGREQSEEEKAENFVILERARDANSFLYEQLVRLKSQRTRN